MDNKSSHQKLANWFLSSIHERKRNDSQSKPALRFGLMEMLTINSDYCSLTHIRKPKSCIFLLFGANIGTKQRLAYSEMFKETIWSNRALSHRYSYIQLYSLIELHNLLSKHFSIFRRLANRRLIYKAW